MTYWMTLWSSGAILHQKYWSTLVQIMTCGTRLWQEPLLTYCQLDRNEKAWLNQFIFEIENVCKTSIIFSNSMCQYRDIYNTAVHCVNFHADNFTLVSLWCSCVKLSITMYFGVGDILAGVRNFICNLLRHKQESPCGDTISHSCFKIIFPLRWTVRTTYISS